MGTIQKFEDLIAWQKAHRMVLEIYRITRKFPADERYVIVPQMRRAAISVPSNIAEGFKKRGSKDKIKYFNIAQGSLAEVRHLTILSRDLSYLNDGQPLNELIEEIDKMLHALVVTTNTLFPKSQLPNDL